MAIAEALLRDTSWAFTSATFRALGYTFSVRTTDAAYGRYYDRVFRPLRTEEPVEHTYSVIDHGPATSPRYSTYFDDEELLSTDAPLYCLRWVLWHVNQHASTRSGNYIVFHASAAEHAGRGLIFPASMESGKSTLVAGLVRNGFGYLTDEAVALDPTSGLIIPFPRAISLDEGSWRLFPELEPDLEPEVADIARAQWQVDPDVIRPGARAQPCPPGMIITPRYFKGEATQLLPLSRAEAIAALVENSFNFTDFGAAGLTFLANVVRACRCYRLIVGDLDEACRLIESAAPAH